MTTRTLRALTAIVACSLVLAGVARATHANPGAKAKKIVADLVVAYEPCTVPDTLTGSGYDACSVPVRSDPVCGFGPTGKGQLKLKASASSIKVRFKLSGLEPACEGSIMGVIFRWRVTGHQCGGAACTVDETDYMPGYGACTVTNGSCVLTSTGDLPALDAGGQTGVELIGADIVRNGNIPAFRMGFFWP